eukprot:c13169_g1_i1 orf=165-662(+)
MTLEKFSFLILMFLGALITSGKDVCVYTVYVRTGKVMKGGTDSTIGAQFYDAYGNSIIIDSLEEWGGLMGSHHNYYERGNLDIFSGLGECLSTSICAMNLTSDGHGSHSGWYCNYVQVAMISARNPCSQHFFSVDQWLAFDAAPYQLNAFRNDCNFEEAHLSLNN